MNTVLPARESPVTPSRTVGAPPAVAASSGRLNLDIVDYPGEWLLDLALLRKSYAEWSAEVIAGSRQFHRAGSAEAQHAKLASVDPAAPENEGRRVGWRRLSPHTCKKARAQEHALSTFTPGRFLMPGDLAGSPALTFSPLDITADYSSPRDTLAAIWGGGTRPTKRMS
jgi:uncharacterized protein